MTKEKLFCVTVRGHRRRWGFFFYGDPKHLAAWRADGLDVDEVGNTIPEWVVDLGLVRPWCIVQDLWQFKNPWGEE